MSKLFFPLRGNSGWFADEDTNLLLQRKVKTSLVLYDHLIFQDGRYQLTVWDTGNLDWVIGGEAVPGDRNDILYSQPGGHMELRVGETEKGVFHPVLSGPARAAYQVDFFPILTEGGLHSEPGVQLLPIEISSEGKDRLKPCIAQDRKDKDLIAQLPGSRFEQGKLIEAAHTDSLLSQVVGAPFTADNRIGEFIKAKNGRIAEADFIADLRPFILGRLFSLGLPDFAQAPWDQILKIRNSGAGVDFRRLVERLLSELMLELENFESQRDLEDHVSRLFVGELVEEIRAMAPTTSGLVWDVALNLVPYGGVVAGAGTLADLIAHKGSWISLLR